MQILEDLYIGEVRPSERCGSRNRQHVKALNELVKVEEELNASLNDEQKKLFADFEDAQREVSVLTDIETFTAVHFGQPPLCFCFAVGEPTKQSIIGGFIFLPISGTFSVSPA